jgi:hypothetical protein
MRWIVGGGRGFIGLSIAITLSLSKGEDEPPPSPRIDPAIPFPYMPALSFFPPERAFGGYRY